MAGLDAIRSIMVFDRERSGRIAGWLAVGLAVALPWSTSATGILVVLWLIAILPTIDAATWRRVLTTPVGGLPVILCALATVGMLWAAGVPMAERWGGLNSFFKLLCIPLFIMQFSRYPHGERVMIGFLTTCGALLILSWALIVVPGLSELWPIHTTSGIPTRDYIAQSGEFTVCIFVLARIGLDEWRARRYGRTAVCSVLAALFLGNILYVSTSRTVLVVIPILLLIFAARHLPWKATAGVVIAGVLAMGLTWSLAPLVRSNVVDLIGEMRDFRPESSDLSRAGLRIEFWRKSVGFIADAPLIGHGTGSILDQFRRSVVGQTGLAGTLSANPHNQILTVAVQLGFAGTVVLFAMWLAHLMLFRGEGIAAWTGLVIVSQNFIGSLFNSHLFDFSQGWLYVIGVGVAAGMVTARKLQPG